MATRHARRRPVKARARRKPISRPRGSRRKAISRRTSVALSTRSIIPTPKPISRPSHWMTPILVRWKPDQLEAVDAELARRKAKGGHRDWWKPALSRAEVIRELVEERLAQLNGKKAKAVTEFVAVLALILVLVHIAVGFHRR